MSMTLEAGRGKAAQVTAFRRFLLRDVPSGVRPFSGEGTDTTGF